MTKDEALKLALEALEPEPYLATWYIQECVVPAAITAIKAALSGEAQEDKDEPWTPDDTAYRPNGLPQNFIKHEVESLEDWSEWVCPNPDEYFMKCCDCGLVHEVQYRVARYGEGDYCELVDDKDVQAQFRMRRRTTLQQEKNDEKPWVCECGAGSYSACKCVFKAALEAKDEPWEKFCDSNCVWTDHHPDCKLAQPEHCSDCGQKLGYANHIHTCSPQLKQEPVAYLSQGGNFSFEPWQGSTPLYTTPPQRTWVGLTDAEVDQAFTELTLRKIYQAIEAKLKEKNT